MRRLQCVLLGHDDRVLRTPTRVALECWHCGRTTPGWQVGTTKEVADMKQWQAWIATIPMSGLFAWAVARFIDWRRRLLRSVLGEAEHAT